MVQPTIQPSCQQRFHDRWDHLQDCHVRALAWLLDAPDLLDASAMRWHGKIATLVIDVATTANWLASLDSAPQELHAFLQSSSSTRLGRYAEKLMAWYFIHINALVAHGLQIRTAGNQTIGEFDFLVRQDQQLVHYEFASKFYLFEKLERSDLAGCFIGPNLADSLEAKMDKILNRQLALGLNSATLPYLSEPVSRAQALIKGWLFYPMETGMRWEVDGDHSIAEGLAPLAGIAANHCRGFWCDLQYFLLIRAQACVVLPRAKWLAPAKVNIDQLMDCAAMGAWLQDYFLSNTMPVLVAFMRLESVQEPTVAREISRGFIVPNDWREKALHMNQSTFQN